MDARIENYGHTDDGQPVQRITLDDGIGVQILTFGGIVARLETPDRAGMRDNVVLGLPDLATYVARNPNFGTTVGRFAGRIAGGRFALDGVTHVLSANEGLNTLHGGTRGFGQRVWRLEQATTNAVTLALTSVDGDEGFPGTLETRVTFTVEGTSLRIDYEARTDRATVLNLTNHSYFNLAGGGDVLGHELRIDADRILELNARSLPTGAVLDVTATPFDFRTPAPVGARIREAHPQIVFGLGYDACFVLRGEGFREVAAVRDPASGRVMTVRTDQPAVQLYTANKLTGALIGPAGRTYRAGDALCLETQHYPDSPNQPSFPSTVLRSGAVFRSRTEYSFGTAERLGGPGALG